MGGRKRVGSDSAYEDGTYVEAAVCGCSGLTERALTKLHCSTGAGVLAAFSAAAALFSCASRPNEPGMFSGEESAPPTLGKPAHTERGGGAKSVGLRPSSQGSYQRSKSYLLFRNALRSTPYDDLDRKRYVCR